jgi:hypothetical protein
MATVLIDHDKHKAQERLERAISKAWRTRGVPEPALDPNVPLRIQVTPPPGLQIEGRGWLHNPVLDWDASEIECLCKPRLPPRLQESSPPATQCRAKIEVWGEDLMRLWGGNAPNPIQQGVVSETGSGPPEPSSREACHGGTTTSASPSTALSMQIQRDHAAPYEVNTPTALYYGCTFITAPLIWSECPNCHHAPHPSSDHSGSVWQRLLRSRMMLARAVPCFLNGAEACRSYLTAVSCRIRDHTLIPRQGSYEPSRRP